MKVSSSAPQLTPLGLNLCTAKIGGYSRVHAESPLSRAKSSLNFVPQREPKNSATIGAQSKASTWTQKAASEESTPKAEVDALVLQSKAGRKSAKNPEEFNAFITNRYGNHVRAWRLALDTDDSGNLSYVEFCRAVRALGYEGSLRELWYHFDVSGNGSIGINEFAPALGEILDSFRQFFLDQGYERAEDVFKALAQKGLRRLNPDHFVQGCQWMEWPGKARQLHKLLDAGITGYITESDLEWLGFKGRAADEDEKEAKARAAEEKRKNRELSLRGPKDHDAFLTFLIHKFGNAVRAWRLCIDKDGSNRLTYLEFCEVLRSVGYQGDMRVLWQKLDEDGSGIISFTEMAPETAQILANFKSFLIDTCEFETAQQCWNSLAVRRQPRLDENDFVEGLARLGWTDKPRQLHRWLDSDICRGVGFITIQDIMWLGLPTTQESEVQSRVRSGEKMYYARMSAWQTNVMTKANEIKMSQDHEKAQRMTPQSLNEFLAHIKRFCGNLVRAWRLRLDKDGSGNITYVEFCQGVRHLGYDGSIRKLWQDLDPYEKGYLSLADLNMQTAQSLERFRSYLITNYETGADAWSALAPNGQQRLNMHEFVEGCRKIGWISRPRALHQMLDSDPVQANQVTWKDIEWLGVFDTGARDDPGWDAIGGNPNDAAPVE